MIRASAGMRIGQMCDGAYRKGYRKRPAGHVRALLERPQGVAADGPGRLRRGRPRSTGPDWAPDNDGGDMVWPSASTTLSDPQLSKPLFCLLHPEHVSGPADKEQARKDLLYERADLRKRQVWSVAWPHPFGLKKRIGDRADHLMVLPSGIRPTFEVIEPEFGFEILVVLFDAQR